MPTAPFDHSCTEIHSRGLEYTDEGRHVTVLFGDGAGAVVLGPTEEPNKGVLSVHLHADGRFARELMIEAPGVRAQSTPSRKSLQ